MTIFGVLMFLAAYSTAASLPGPGLASLVARVLGRGLDGIPAYIAGFVVGDLIWFTAAATGLTALVIKFEPLLLFVRLAGAAYLLFISFKLITSDPGVLEKADRSTSAAGGAKNFTAGLALTLGNPKIIVFFVALLPSVLDVKHLTLASGGLIAASMALVLTIILGAYALMAARSRKLFNDRKAMRALNMGTGAVMAGAAAAIATR